MLTTFGRHIETITKATEVAVERIGMDKIPIVS